MKYANPYILYIARVYQNAVCDSACATPVLLYMITKIPMSKRNPMVPDKNFHRNRDSLNTNPIITIIIVIVHTEMTGVRVCLKLEG